MFLQVVIVALALVLVMVLARVIMRNGTVTPTHELTGDMYFGSIPAEIEDKLYMPGMDGRYHIYKYVGNMNCPGGNEDGTISLTWRGHSAYWKGTRKGGRMYVRES